jgi:hypothetical protein
MSMTTIAMLTKNLSIKVALKVTIFFIDKNFMPMTTVATLVKFLSIKFNVHDNGCYAGQVFIDKIQCP